MSNTALAEIERDTLARIQRLHALDQAGKIKTLAQHEVHPDVPVDSRERYLYFTLPPSINFQRSSPALWQAAYKTWHDPQTNYLFYPEEVVRRELAETTADMRRYSLAVQPNRHPLIWITLSRTLNSYYDNHPRNVLAAGDFDVPRIIQMLQSTHKDRFPYLGGIKLSNYWLFILSRFTDVQLANMHEISIIPDTHVLRSTVHLGLAEPGVTPAQAEAIWRPILKQLDIPPTEMHSTLWKWSRDGFQPEP